MDSNHHKPLIRQPYYRCTIGAFRPPPWNRTRTFRLSGGCSTGELVRDGRETRNRTVHGELVRITCCLELSPWSRSWESNPALLVSETSRPPRAPTSIVTEPGRLTPATFGVGKTILSCGCSGVCDNSDCRPARSNGRNGGNRTLTDSLMKRTSGHRTLRHTAKVTLPAHQFWGLSPRLLGAVYMAYSESPAWLGTFLVAALVPRKIVPDTIVSLWSGHLPMRTPEGA